MKLKKYDDLSDKTKRILSKIVVVLSILYVVIILPLFMLLSLELFRQLEYLLKWEITLFWLMLLYSLLGISWICNRELKKLKRKGDLQSAILFDEAGLYFDKKK